MPPPPVLNDVLALAVTAMFVKVIVFPRVLLMAPPVPDLPAVKVIPLKFTVWPLPSTVRMALALLPLTTMTPAPGPVTVKDLLALNGEARTIVPVTVGSNVILPPSHTVAIASRNESGPASFRFFTTAGLEHWLIVCWTVPKLPSKTESPL
jgi:hypothetical protein